MNREPPRAATLAVIIARNCPDATPHRVALAVEALVVSAQAHKKVATNRCNYGYSVAAERRQDKRLDGLAAAAQEALDLCGKPLAAMSLDMGGDPRGPCGRLLVDGMPGDGWGAGFAIYA